jgi:2-polyprenyl-3-methyl-5-hydroxy-6-metoxy-1,4-benzoquinol methylase
MNEHSLGRKVGLRLNEREVTTTSEMMEAYREQINRYGFTPKSLFYSNDEIHAAKISHYASLAHRLIEGFPKVLDVGCGYGSLVPFLPTCEYVGIDVIEEFVIEARRRYAGARFEHTSLHDFKEKCDWVLIPGMMGSVVDPDAVVEDAWSLCRSALIVDFINSSKYTGSSLNSYDIGTCVEIFLEKGSTHVEVIECPSFNWTILVAWRSGPWLLS